MEQDIISITCISIHLNYCLFPEAQWNTFFSLALYLAKLELKQGWTKVDNNNNLFVSSAISKNEYKQGKGTKIL